MNKMRINYHNIIQIKKVTFGKVSRDDRLINKNRRFKLTIKMFQYLIYGNSGETGVFIYSFIFLSSPINLLAG